MRSGLWPSLEHLTDDMVQRDIERSARERTLREGEERMREIALSLEGERRTLPAALQQRERCDLRSRVLARRRADAGGFFEVNDVACARLGYTREELLRLSPADIDEGSSAEGSTAPELQAALRALREHGSILFQQVHVAKDGRRIPVEINSHLLELQGPAGRPLDRARRDRAEARRG